MKIKSNLTIPSTFVIVLIFLLPTTNLHSQTVNDSFNGSGSLNSGWWTVQLDNGSNGSVNVISGQCIVVSGNNASNQAEAFTNVQGNQSNQYSLTIKFVSVSGGQNSGTVFGVGSVAELSGSNGPLAKGIQVVKASNNDSFSQNDGVWVEDSIVYHTPPSDGDIVTIIIANGMYIVKYNSNVVASNSLSLSPANDYAAILRARSGGSNGEEGTAIFDDFALTINAQCGETCANACQLSGITGSIDYTTTSSNIDDYSGSNCAGGGGGNPNGNSSDLVYELTTPVSPGDTLTFWTSNDNYDVVLYGRFGSCIGTQIGCIAEPDGTPITWVNNTGTAQNVWFFVDGNSSVGSATLNWQIKSSLPPLCGETCANACQISGMTGNVDYTITSSNTDDYVGSNCIGGGGGNPNGNSSDLVYELITPIPMGYTLTFWTSNDNYDVVLYGRFGSCIGIQIGCIAEPDGTPITWVNNTGTAQNVWFFVDGNDSVGSATLNWDIITGIKELDFKTINLYPNPTDGILNIEYELRKPSPVTLEFYSITGRKIFALNDKETTINHHQISLKELHLQSGVYYLRIGGEDGFVTRKVVLMK